MTSNSNASLNVIRDPGSASTMLHPVRRLLLDKLKEPNSASGLAREMKVPRQKLNYHLRELEKKGLIECVEERRRGNCTERVMRATAKSFVINVAEINGQPADPEQIQDKFSSDYQVALAARLIHQVSDLQNRATEANKKLATMSLQTDIRFASAADRNAFAEELTQTLARLTARYNQPDAPKGRNFRFLLLGHPDAGT